MPDGDIITAKTEEEVQKELAVRDLGDIQALRTTLPFERYFRRRLREKIAPLERAILEEELGDVALQQKKRERKIYTEILNLLDTDEVGNRSIAEIG